MLSLYIHIPFCSLKCKYCSFFVMPESEIQKQSTKQEVKTPGMTKAEKLESVKDQYLQSLLAENQAKSEAQGNQQIKTIYIGGGTPFQLGAERLYVLIDALLKTRDTTFLEELSIELNPDPFDEVIDFVAQAQKKYKDVFRLRFSFGVQSFDDKILEQSGRNYIFNNLINFFREIVAIKAANTVYNLDFIAFGDKGTQKKKANSAQEYLPRDIHRRNFFEKIVGSKSFDGYSAYTLELFPGAERYYEKKALSLSTQENEQENDSIWAEFQWLKDTLMNGGYRRYEVSNFALSGKRSLHNTVYREMGSYLGLGINASSMIRASDGEMETRGTRTKNTTNRKKYLAGEWYDESADQTLDKREWRIESALLALRTDQGINIASSQNLFVNDREKIIEDMITQGYATIDDTGRLTLTSLGFDIYNGVLMELFREV